LILKLKAFFENELFIVHLPSNKSPISNVVLSLSYVFKFKRKYQFQTQKWDLDSVSWSTSRVELVPDTWIWT